MSKEKLKVLVSDPLGDAGLAILRAVEGIEVFLETGLDKATLKKRLNEVDAVVIRSETKITADVLEGNTRLKVIGRAGIGVDNVEVPAATAKGILVMNTPGGNAITTAEHTISLMMAAARKIPQAYAKLKSGKWDRKSFVGTELSGKTLGVAGLGNIGALVVERALGLKMNVIGYDPFITPERAKQLGVELAELDEVIKRADVLTLHVPLTDKTRNLINAEKLKTMKPSAILINCARGGIVDEKALDQALKDGTIAAAALDVFEVEPPPADHPLLQNEKVIYTPHLGASTVEAQYKVAVDVAQQIVDYLIKGEIKNAVNAPSVTGELLSALKPYMKLGQTLGKLVVQLHDKGVEKITLRLAGDIAKLDTSPVVALAVASVLSYGTDEPVNEVNALATAKARGIAVETTKTQQSEDYTASVTVSIEGQGQQNTASGAVFGKNDPRIVRINNYQMEPLSASARQPLVLFTNKDVPGVIGKVGTLFGDAKLNIAQMNVGRASAEKGMALTVIQLDEAASAPVLEKLKQLDGIVNVRQVLL